MHEAALAVTGTYMVQPTLTSLLCPHGSFFTEFSYSILVCCSHGHVVGRVGHQTKDVIGQCHPSRNSNCFKEAYTHSIWRVYPSVPHLINGQTVVMGCQGVQGNSMYSVIGTINLLICLCRMAKNLQNLKTRII